MIVPEQLVETKWVGRTKSYYTNLGYVFTKRNDIFNVRVEHLKDSSNVKVKFICNYCIGKNQTKESHKFKEYWSLIKDNRHCCNHIECKSKKASETNENKHIQIEVSLGVTHPNLILEWSDKNKKTPYEYTKGSDKIVWWKCENNHEWESTISNRVGGNGCPYCCGRYTTEEKSIIKTHPELIKEWSFTKNEISPSCLSNGSNKIVWWIGKCGHEWDCSVSNRTNGNGCPYCCGKRVCTDNCLATVNPSLSSEWHPTKNGDLTPNDVVLHSHNSVWWVCPEGHEWSTGIDNRARGSNCPYCAGQKVCSSNCLFTVNPELSNEWHPFKNGTLTSKDITSKSNKKIWWLCAKGHEWKKSANYRSKHKNCPQCYLEENCLANKYPEIISEWNILKNGDMTPYNVTTHSAKKIWWVCQKCKHEWKTSVDNRCNGTNCPSCNESKGERRIRNWLNNKFCFEWQKEFEGLIGVGGGLLSYDFYIPDSNLLIEFQGEYHDGTAYNQTKKELAKQQEHDKRKREYCEQNNINLLEIWYWDFDNIENILENNFKVI